ncbi:3515_t:CDS:1, partial [Scutellospora calospora]
AKDAVQKISGICKAHLTEECQQWRKEYLYIRRQIYNSNSLLLDLNLD